MPYEAFHTRFPEIAREETRLLTVLQSANLGVPPGEYLFLEMYCNERGCDCRRVFFHVASPPNFAEALAVVAYGWEDPDFYARWFGSADPRDIAALKGPMLNLASPQSSLAPAILKLVSDVLLRDGAFLARLKRHYQMFRADVEGGTLHRKFRPRKKKRRK
jgi:hypothetical protein